MLSSANQAANQDTSTQPVCYLRDNYRVTAVRRTETPKSGSQSGYGNKLPMSIQIQIAPLHDQQDGKPDINLKHRWYMMYAICHSNTVSCYIIKSGIEIFLSDCDLPEMSDK